MKLKPWRFFVITTAIVSTLLLLIVFFTFGHEKFHALNIVCIFVLTAISLTGATRGFIRYVIKRKAYPWADTLRFIFYLKKTNSVFISVITLCLLCLAATSEFYFALTIFNLSSSSKDVEIRPGTPFYIEKPGVYTLWVDWGVQVTDNIPDAIGQFLIKRLGNNEVVLGKVLASESLYRRNGENFSAVCDYSFLTSSRYILLQIGKRESLSILLRPKISKWEVIVAFCCFLSGILFALIAGCLFLVKNQTNNLPLPNCNGSA